MRRWCLLSLVMQGGGPMNYEYETIKQLAKEMGCKVTDLIPLAPQNDPFYTGTPTDWALAQWFAGLWQQFGYNDKVHIRRVHYQIVSQRSEERRVGKECRSR